MHKLKLLLTRIYLTVMATNPMIKLTQDECKVLLDAYALYGAEMLYICYSLSTYASNNPAMKHIAFHVEREVMNMLLSGWRRRDFSNTADDLNMGRIQYRVQWINQVMAYNDYPNKLHIIENGVLPRILSK